MALGAVPFTVEIHYLVWSVAFAILQIVFATWAKRSQDTLAWGTGNRDEPAGPYTGVPGRIDRASINFFETFPIFVAAVLAARMAGVENWMTAWGAGIYFWGRVAHLPAYVAGLTRLRSLTFTASAIGIVMIVAAVILGPAPPL